MMFSLVFLAGISVGYAISVRPGVGLHQSGAWARWGDRATGMDGEPPKGEPFVAQWRIQRVFVRYLPLILLVCFTLGMYIENRPMDPLGALLGILGMLGSITDFWGAREERDKEISRVKDFMEMASDPDGHKAKARPERRQDQ